MIRSRPKHGRWGDDANLVGVKPAREPQNQPAPDEDRELVAGEINAAGLRRRRRIADRADDQADARCENQAIRNVDRHCDDRGQDIIIHEGARREAYAVSERKRNIGQRRDAPEAEFPARHLFEVRSRDAHDLREGKRSDGGERQGVETQHHCANHRGRERRHEHRQTESDPRRDCVIGRGERGHIGADPEEGLMARDSSCRRNPAPDSTPSKTPP